MTTIEARLATLERRDSGGRVVRIFQQVDFDDPTYFHELTPGADGLRLFSQSDLDAIRESSSIVKAVWD